VSLRGVHVRAVLRTPGVLPPFAATLVARLPVTALGLIYVLHVQELTGSFALAGLAAGAYALAMGIAGPLLGRLIDARGTSGVLSWCAAITAAALVAAALLPESVPPAAFIALAALTGLGMPPMGAVLRTLWMAALPDPDRRHAAFALDSAVGEVLYVIGPAGLAGGVAAWSPSAAMLICAVLVLAGTSAFIRVAGPMPTHTGPRGGLAGALGSPALRSLIVVFALMGTTFGAVEVGVAAVAEHAGERALAGPLLAVWAVGSVIGGVIAVRMGASADPSRRMTLQLGLLAVAHAPLVLASSPLVAAPLLLVAGVSIAPVLSTGMALVGETAPPGTVTEAFTWTSTGITAGIATGAALGGILIDAGGPDTSFILAAVVCVLAAGVGVLRRPVLAAGLAGAGAA
jgi:MFS family permease